MLMNASRRIAALRSTHVVRINQAADRLQRAESVVLIVELTAAGVPDKVAALLMGQNVCCGSLSNNHMSESLLNPYTCALQKVVFTPYTLSQKRCMLL